METTLRRLMADAGEHGDCEQVVLCLEALGEDDGRFPEIPRVGRDAARRACVRAIEDARAQREG